MTQSVDNPLLGENRDEFGLRFPRMNDLYSKGTRNLVKQVAYDLGIELAEGMYIHMKGPKMFIYYVQRLKRFENKIHKFLWIYVFKFKMIQ